MGRLVGAVPELDLTLQEAAELLGVHYMTAYRYVRLGLLPARKEASTWRVDRADADAFRAGLDVAVRAPGQGRRRAPWADRLEARLVAGDGRGAWGVVEAALAAGSDLETIYLDVIAPALTSIGERWATGDVDVAVEHRAIGITLRIVGRLGPRFVRRGRTRGAVVLGATPGEHHGLPVALVADVVRGAGWEVHDLGADVPAADFASVALATPRLVAVGVSVTTSACLEAASATVRELRGVLPEPVPVLAGGGAVRDGGHAAELGAGGWAGDGRGVVELLDALAPRRSGLAPAH